MTACRIFPFVLFVLLFVQICPSWQLKFESCCTDEKITNATTTVRLLACPLNYVLKLRAVNFYTGNGCARSACQRRLNKHYLPCNNHRTCSISIKCVLMDSTICPWLTLANTRAQHLIVDYDCLLYEPESPLNALNRLTTTTTTTTMTRNHNRSKDQHPNIVLFSAKVNIETPPDMIPDNNNKSMELTDDERAWKEFLLKQYLNGKRPPKFYEERSTIIQERSLFNDILRTVLILIVFMVILIVLMFIGLLIYKRIILFHRKKYSIHQQKHEPFPGDDAYDNLKTNGVTSTADSGTATDV